MKHQRGIRGTFGWHLRLCAAGCLAVLLPAFIAGGCSFDLSTGQPDSKDGAAGGSAGLPRLLDLGAGKCIPCKMMAPILDDLEQQYEGVIEVEFIDVWQNPDEAKKYGVSTIPTQIFFDASGKERFRHVGFFSKEDILAKWKELGVKLQE